MGEIERAGLTNVVVVVTRYFGGIKLGVRGLIEAYGQTARMAIEAAGAIQRFKGKSYLWSFPMIRKALFASSLSPLEQKKSTGSLLMEKTYAFAGKYLCLK